MYLVTPTQVRPQYSPLPFENKLYFQENLSKYLRDKYPKLNVNAMKVSSGSLWNYHENKGGVGGIKKSGQNIFRYHLKILHKRLVDKMSEDLMHGPLSLLFGSKLVLFNVACLKLKCDFYGQFL